MTTDDRTSIADATLPPQHVAHHPDVVFTDLDTEGVVIHSTSGEAFRLNSSGVLLWRSCPADTYTLAHALVRAWKISPEQAHADVAAWLAALQQHGLLIVSANPPGANGKRAS